MWSQTIRQIDIHGSAPTDVGPASTSLVHLPSRHAGCLLIVVALVGSVALVSPARAQEAGVASEATPTAQDLPDGNSILDANLEATGGKERYQKLKTMVAMGEMDFEGMGLKAALTVTQVSPDRFVTKVDLPNIGQIIQCANRTVCWEVNPMSGARILAGEERQSMLREADSQAPLHPEKYFEKIECVARVEVDGKPCYKVELTTHDGSKEINYYQTDSKLLVQTERQHASPIGKIALKVTLSDYRDIEGMKVPFRTEIHVMGQKRIIQMNSVTVNGEVDETAFEAPEEIQKLLKVQAAAERNSDSRP